MSDDDLLAEIALVFPHVPKPKELDISFHKGECFHCQYLRKDLESFSEPELPRNALRTLFNEMSCLSAAGWRWVLPSYLKCCITPSGTQSEQETEFLIYNLGPLEKHQAETLERLGKLNDPQIGCLIHFLEWCETHPHWSEYCPEDISRALTFMRGLKSNPSIDTDARRRRPS